MSESNSSATLRIGWAEVDITPEKLPVYIVGQYHARISEGVADPLQATALALEMGGQHAVFVSVDTCGITKELRDAVRQRLREDGLDPMKVVFHATHTHEAPMSHLTFNNSYQLWGNEPEDLAMDVVPAPEYIRFASAQIATAISEAWQKRAPGGIAYGQDYAVIGRNRRWFAHDGVATMYNLNESTADRFDTIEGYEDHSLNLMATYDEKDVLVGIVVNLPCPSQEDEHLFSLSADFWCETRQELRARFGENLFILPQCSAAGELTSHLLFEKEPHQRMLELRGRTARQEVAVRIADAVGRVLPYLPPTIERAPLFEHHYETLQLPMNKLVEADAEDAQQSVDYWLPIYHAEKQKVLDNPKLREEPRWYVEVTQALNHVGYFRGVIERYEQSKNNPTQPSEVHILRLGEISFATNPFEYYLDFGIQIKVKSPSLQTFVVQLCGSGASYVPSARAAAGGGYGAVPASNPVGPEGGQILADYTIEKIREMWDNADL